MFNPHGSEGLLDVFEMEKETEDELVAKDSFARYYEGQRELDVIVQSEGIDTFGNGQSHLAAST